MALYGYIKKEPDKDSQIINKSHLSWLLSVVGLVLIGNAIIPIVNYQFHYAYSFGDKKISPLVYESKEQTLGVVSAEAKSSQDYTLVTSWFEEKPDLNSDQKVEVDRYYLSIPRLGIDRAKVKVGGEDLKKNLIHYSNTSLPGRAGNGVIFGHSVLPQFFDPQNYLTIFSTLHRLEQGDKIIIELAGVDYEYLVQELYEVKPDDLSILEQAYDRYSLSLVTCTPPGTYLRRLVVKGRLIE